MIFTEIIIHNFGIYKGRHVVDLTPKSANRPIILLGGLNGGGKTTFLDALQLTLYGKFAKCSNREELSYNDYLKDSINRHVDPKDGAALELEFIIWRRMASNSLKNFRSFTALSIIRHNSSLPKGFTR